MQPRHVWWIVLGIACLGCKRPSVQKISARPGASTQASATAPRRLQAPPAPGAFDLTSIEGGAALLVADANGAAFTLSLFDESGARRETQSIRPSASDVGQAGLQIAEVVAVSSGADLALAWLEKSGTDAHARGLVRSLAGESRGPVVDLGAVQTPFPTPRGNLAIASADQHFSVLARGEKAACIDPTESDCVGFAFSRLDAAGKSPQGAPLTVPLPCDENSVSFAVAGNRRYYGVCSRSTGKAVTTLFSIQTDPEYARADRILEGCLPLGALSIDGALVIVGDCGGQRRGVRIRPGNAEPEEVRVERLDASCQAGSPSIRQVGTGGLHLALTGRRDRLEAFLPDAYRLPQARAVWTGQTLLVAGLAAGSVTLKGYQCDSTLLREVSVGRSKPVQATPAR